MVCESPLSQPLDAGLLQAYLDGELTGSEKDVVAVHLATCAFCQEALGDLRKRSGNLAALLATLDPPPQEVPAAGPVLAGIRAAVRPAGSTLRYTVTRSVDNMRRSLRMNAGWRVVAIGGLVVAMVVAMFSFAPTRQALADFLAVFRVRKFAVISVDQQRVQQLEELEEMLDSGLFGEPEYLREPGEPQVVADVAEAEALAGFDARVPGEMPEGASLSEVAVEMGPHVRMSVERSTMETALAFLGVTDVTLPSVDRVTVEADVPAAVSQTYDVANPYGERDASFTIVQSPSPAVDVPPEIDPAAMGEILLQALGMQPDEARRVAQSIDWTSTFVLPMPADMVNSYDVEVGGQPAVMLEEQPGRDGYRRRKVLLWEQDGIVYAVNAENLTAPVLLQIAESLR